MADMAHGLHKNKDWIKTFNSAFSGKQMLFSRWWPRTAVMNYRLSCKGLLSCQAHNVVDQRQVKHDETCMYRMKVRVEACKMSFDIRSFTKDPNVLLQFSPYESCSLPVTPPQWDLGHPRKCPSASRLSWQSRKWARCNRPKSSMSRGDINLWIYHDISYP